MIFLRAQNVLFLKPEKVAGTSFEIALSKYAGARDIITRINKKDEETRTRLGFRGPQNHKKRPSGHGLRYGWNRLRGKSADLAFTQHMTAAEAELALGPGVFENALKVSIVRHPVDRIISHYHWRNKAARDKPRFGDWVRANPEIINFNDRFYFLHGRDIIDFYIQFEDLAGDTDRLISHVPALDGLSGLLKDIRSKGDVRPKEKGHRDHVGDDADLLASVRFFNRDHIARFGYAV